MEESMTYEEALEKLQLLQQQLEDGEISIEGLAQAMSEANQLMNYCKNRLRVTEDQLKSIQDTKDNQAF